MIYAGKSAYVYLTSGYTEVMRLDSRVLDLVLDENPMEKSSRFVVKEGRISHPDLSFEFTPFSTKTYFYQLGHYEKRIFLFSFSKDCADPRQMDQLLPGGKRDN